MTKNVSQNWNVRYVKNEQTYQTGEYHPRYGFYCNRQFYIVSKRDGRHLQQISNQVQTKTRNGLATQKWSFNCKAEAIFEGSNRVFQMQSNGGKRNLVVGGHNMNTKFTGWWGDFSYKNE